MIIRNEVGANAKGGTENMTNKLEVYLQAQAPELLEKIDIFPSRVRPVENPAPFKVFFAHDLELDPEAKVLSDPDQFDLIVFVSNYQYAQYQRHFRLNGHNCIVLPNAIDFLGAPPRTKFNDIGTKQKPIRLIYHTTPHRGLELLIPAFIKMNAALKEQNIYTTLDVYSSFKIYGWDSRDNQYESLFEVCKTHPDIYYHGTVPNSEIRSALKNTHIFAYPSIWTETSCISLIEAMEAENICVHSNLGALPETSGGLTNMYRYVKDPNDHLEIFYNQLHQVCSTIGDASVFQMEYLDKLKLASRRVELIYDWTRIAPQWKQVLQAISETS